MKTLKKWQLFLIVVVAVLGIGIFSGWRMHQSLRPCPVVSHDTINNVVHVVDSIKVIAPYYTTVIKEILVPVPIKLSKEDSLNIFKIYNKLYTDFNIKKVQERKFQDSLLKVIMIDTIQHNEIKAGSFKYELIYPHQTIINSTTINEFNNTLYAGLAAPIKDLNNLYASVLWTTPKYYLQANYSLKDKGFLIGAGLPIWKLKTTKK